MRPRRRGILLYVSLGLIATLAVYAGYLLFIAQWSEVNAIYVYHSEVITNLAEAAIEEAFYNFERRLNDPAGNNKLYDQLRKPWDVQAGAADIKIEPEVMVEACAAARSLGGDLYGIPPEKFVVSGQIARIEPFLIRGFNPPDPIEKTAAIEIAVTITMGELTKEVIASRPVKVVRTTIPVLAESTLFVNNLQAENFAHWPSAMGYDPDKFPEPQKTVTLDHGWAKYSKTNKKGDFLKLFEEQIFKEGLVPPGRVFIREGIVPLTNGDRAAGALQKTFFSAESELLPVLPPIPLKSLKEGLREDHIEATERERRAEIARQNQEGIELHLPSGQDAGSEGASPSTSPSDESTSVPEEGELIIRYLGSGLELIESDMKEHLGGNDGDGFRTYFSALADGPWGSNPPVKSGLDLFGRTTEKEKGEAVSGGNLLTRIWNKVKEIGEKLLSKLYAKYDIRLSPTLVYGSVLQTYYMARDYAFTGWWENVKHTFGDKQIPIPYFPDGHFDGLPDDQPMTKEQLPEAWEDKFKDRFMKLPEDIRKPGFLKTLDGWATGITKQIGPLLPDSLREKVEALPQGTIVSPYHMALKSFLQPPPDSGYDTWVDGYRKAAQPMEDVPGRGMFLSNLVEKRTEGLKGPYEPFFEMPLSEFNPFLFYVKATDYISSLWDPRLPDDAPPEQKNVFLRKFRDAEDAGLLHLDGVIYITGTEDLYLKNFRYTGKGIMITFGRVIFDGFFVKKSDSADDPEKNDLLTIISLGGIKFRTSEPVHAQLYSYIYPFEVSAGETMNVFGGVGCNDLPLRFMGDGANINYDWTYHIPRGEIERGTIDAIHYYRVAITDEINKYEYVIQRRHEKLGEDPP